MPSMSQVMKEDSDEIAVRIMPKWRRMPCAASHKGVSLSPDQLAEQINKYCATQYDEGEHPSFCDLAGATGFDSFTQMMNHARRKGGKTMRHISRGFLAVGAGYEQQAQEGSRAAVAMLSKMPQFDTEEPSAQLPQLPFHDRKEVNLNITGIVRPEERGRELSGPEAYLKVIKNKTYEEMAPLIEQANVVDAEYEVLDFPDEPTGDE